MTTQFSHHRETLRLLHKRAGGNFHKAEAAVRADAIHIVWGKDADEGTYRAFDAEWGWLWEKGCVLAEFAVAYGFMPSRDPLSLAALDVAQPYAEQLQVRRAAEAQRVAAGGVGSVAYYATYTNGDTKEAKRLQSEARAREVLR